jgi:hypothetical protein
MGAPNRTFGAHGPVRTRRLDVLAARWRATRLGEHSGRACPDDRHYLAISFVTTRLTNMLRPLSFPSA